MKLATCFGAASGTELDHDRALGAIHVVGDHHGIAVHRSAVFFGIRELVDFLVGEVEIQIIGSSGGILALGEGYDLIAGKLIGIDILIGEGEGGAAGKTDQCEGERREEGDGRFGGHLIVILVEVRR